MRVRKEHGEGNTSNTIRRPFRAHAATRSIQQYLFNEVAATIRKIERVMQLCQHAVYRGNMYAKPDEAQLTYVKLMDSS